MSQHIPSFFKDFVNKETEMPGKNGTINVELQSDKSKTFIKSLATKAPLLVQKAIYPEPGNSQMAHVYMMSSSGGILEGDKQTIDILMGKNSTARITNQSAAKIYRMEGGYASQYVNIHSMGGSYLEFVPNQIIPFKSSRFYQEVNLEVDENATLVYSEIISSGRMASGERFDFDICFLRTTGFRDGKLLFTDVMSMDTRDRSGIQSLFGEKDVFSTVYILGAAIPSEPISAVLEAAAKKSSLLAGCSSLPNDCGIIVRVLANSVSEIVALTESVIGIIRDHANIEPVSQKQARA